MKKIDKLLKQREDQLSMLETTDAEINLLKSKTKVECVDNYQYGSGCGKKYEVRKLQYIQTHWYVSPSECMDGDYWNEGEGQFICPSCKHQNRLYPDGEIQDLKHLFQSIKDTYGEDNYE